MAWDQEQHKTLEAKKFKLSDSTKIVVEAFQYGDHKKKNADIPVKIACRKEITKKNGDVIIDPRIGGMDTDLALKVGRAIVKFAKQFGGGEE